MQVPASLRLRSYGLEVEWLLMWAPLAHSAQMQETRMRVGVWRFSTAELGPRDSVSLLIGQGSEGGAMDGAPLNPIDEYGGLAGGFIIVGVSPDGFFTVEVQATNGGSRRGKDYVVQPGTVLPFMVSARGVRPDFYVDTVVVLQGTLTTTALSSFSLSRELTGP